MSARTIEYTETVTMVTIDCCACGVIFGMPEEFNKRRRKDHAYFYCPSGHTQHYSQKTEEEKLREELSRAKSNLTYYSDTLDREKKSHAATKGQLTKTRRRAEAGVCVHCNRTFANAEQVQRHMATKHKEKANE